MEKTSNKTSVLFFLQIGCKEKVKTRFPTANFWKANILYNVLILSSFYSATGPSLTFADEVSISSHPQANLQISSYKVSNSCVIQFHGIEFNLNKGADMQGICKTVFMRICKIAKRYWRIWHCEIYWHKVIHRVPVCGHISVWKGFLIAPQCHSLEMFWVFWRACAPFVSFNFYF